MIFHPANERGQIDHGWLKANHSFNFGHYYHPDKTGHGTLLVLNDDTISPGQGFGTHPHRDMEIVTIPLTGKLQHRDSTGGEGIISSGEIQVMSAGTGIRHSEFNASPSEELNLLQIWILPKFKGVKPRYEQIQYQISDNQIKQVVGPVGTPGPSAKINQDAYFYLGKFNQNFESQFIPESSKNGLYFFVIDGGLEINGQKLNTRDALGYDHPEKLNIKSLLNSFFLILSIPMEP